MLREKEIRWIEKIADENFCEFIFSLSLLCLKSIAFILYRGFNERIENTDFISIRNGFVVLRKLRFCKFLSWR